MASLMGSVAPLKCYHHTVKCIDEISVIITDTKDLSCVEDKSLFDKQDVDYKLWLYNPVNSPNEVCSINLRGVLNNAVKFTLYENHLTMIVNSRHIDEDKVKGLVQWMFHTYKWTIKNFQLSEVNDNTIKALQHLNQYGTFQSHKKG